MYEPTDENELNELLKNNKFVLLYFYATWCNPCKQLSSDIEKYRSENTELCVVKINVDTTGDLYETYNISSLPTLKLFINNVEKIGLVGYKESHISTIKSFLQ